MEAEADDHDACAYFSVVSFSCMSKTTLDSNAVTIRTAARARFVLCVETACIWGRGMLYLQGNPNYAQVMNVSNYDLKYLLHV